MPQPTRTPDEQIQWDLLYRELVIDCVRREGFKKAQGCIHLCREIADAALVERRNSQHGK